MMNVCGPLSLLFRAESIRGESTALNFNESRAVAGV